VDVQNCNLCKHLLELIRNNYTVCIL